MARVVQVNLGDRFVDDVETVLAKAGWREDPDAAIDIADFLAAALAGEKEVEYGYARCEVLKVIRVRNYNYESGVIVFRHCWDEEHDHGIDAIAVFGNPAARPTKVWVWEEGEQ